MNANMNAEIEQLALSTSRGLDEDGNALASPADYAFQEYLEESSNIRHEDLIEHIFMAGWIGHASWQIHNTAAWLPQEEDRKTAALMETLIEKIERMQLVQDARAIKVEEHPTRERLLNAILWTTREVKAMPAPGYEASKETIEMWSARLLRMAGLE